MSKALAALCCAALSTLAVPAQAQSQSQDGPWMVRLRATYLDMNSSSDGGVLPADAISVNSKWIPEVDVSYFFTKNLAAELVLTIPQKQDVSIEGVGRIGSFKHLPPTLLAQWHFTDFGAFKPYVGAGVNLTFIFDESMSVGGVPVTLDDNSFGPALQFGADYRLDNGWFLNADVKKVWISSDVYLGGTKIDKVSLDPYLFSIGIGKRF
jgi:outer membrane protein